MIRLSVSELPLYIHAYTFAESSALVMLISVVSSSHVDSCRAAVITSTFSFSYQDSGRIPSFDVNPGPRVPLLKDP